MEEHHKKCDNFRSGLDLGDGEKYDFDIDIDFDFD